MDGFLLIDKPAGISSNQVLNILKEKTKIRKMGHTGTLDPFATGLLTVALGEASKVIPYLKEEPKVYEATLKLGIATDTLDREGTVVETKSVPPLDESVLEKIFKSFLGKQTQIPPMFSAKKVGGRKMYELAREGVNVERQPQEIEIFQLSFQIPPAPQEHSPLCQRGVGGDLISFRVSCSRGTYVRVLGADLAGALGTVGHLTELRRVQAGGFRVEEAVNPESDFRLEERLIPMTAALGHLPSVALSAPEAAKIRQGQAIFSQIPSPSKRTLSLSLSPQGRGETQAVVLLSGKNFLGIGEFRGGELRPKRLVRG